MTTIQIIPEELHGVARNIAQSAAQAQSEAQSMRSQIQQLAYTWLGSNSDQFNAEMQDILRSLDTQAGQLDQLGLRLESTASAWEQLDQRGASAFLSGAAGIMAFLPFSGGAAGWLPAIAVPLSIASWQTGLPTWLGDLVRRLFPSFSAPVSDPLVFHLSEPADIGNLEPGAFARRITEKFDAQGAVVTPGAFQQLIDEKLPHPTEVATPPASQYDVYNDVPAQAQGGLYGSAACAPTSISMVLDYFHNKDAAHATATPEQLVGMLDNGDGTSGQGVSLSLMTDDLNELGYKNITVTDKNSLDSLAASLKDGPVIVTSGVSLIGGVARDIQQAGNTMHAMVVKGLTATSVIVNDPWSGVEKVFSREIFSQMWNVGNNVIYSIRP